MMIDEKFDAGIPVTTKYYNKEEKHVDYSKASEEWKAAHMVVTVKKDLKTLDPQILDK